VIQGCGHQVDGGLVHAQKVACHARGCGYAIGADVQAGTAQELATTQGAVLSKPAVVGDMVYVGTTLGNVVALNTELGGDPTVWIYPPAER